MDIRDAWADCRLLTPKQARWLARRGVGPDGFGAVGDLRAVTIVPGAWCWPVYDRAVETPCVVMPVMTFRADEPALVADVVDLLAFDAADPGRWWLWADAVDAVGEWEIINARDGGVLTLHATPLDWLRAGCRGAALVRPFAGLEVGGRGPDDARCPRGSRYLRDYFHGIKAVHCATGIGEAVDSALRKRPPSDRLPEVYEWETENAA